MYQLFGRRSKKSSSRLKKRDLEYIDPDGQDLEYIEDEEYESNEEYYEDEEYESDEKYYEDEEYDEDEGYYEDEEYDEDEGYYEDEEYDEDEGYYEDEEYDEDEEYYQDKEYDTDKKYYGPKTRGFRRILTKITNMSMVDRMIAVTGIGVLLVAVFTGSLYINAKNKEKQIAAFAEIGAQTEHITVIGERGLIAVADVQMARNLAAEFENLEKEENEESEEEAAGNVKVLMNLSSIQKDLKIKFTNEKSGKLIPNVPFEVEVKGPDNKKYILRDDDKDGIIYQKDIEAGKYRVSMVENADTKDYIISTSAATITVRDTIEYKKVDVSDEIKKESQINVKAEDTKVNETAVESVNADTVEWVESTKTPISGTENSIDQYEEISKSNITDPGKTAKINNTMSDWFISDMSTAHYQLLVDESPTPTETPTATPTESPTADPTESPTVTPTVTPAATPTETPTETPTATPTETPTATPTATPAATPTATPTATPKNVQNDTKSKLKDNSGKQIYIKDSSGKYVEAVYADYYKSSKFYKKTTTTTTVEYKYTGWQQIDGKTYFFDKNGNKVTGEQVIQGAKYNFASDGSLSQSSGHLGIDVSKWNGNIDWNAVKNSGISYVIIRCGYRGSTTGALVEDPVFKSNIKGATAAGIKVGIYFFTQATNEVEAVEEASMVLGLIKGYKISYPVFLDVEATEGNNGRADGISKEARTAVCKAFCQTIQNSGYTAGIYANKHWFTSYINTASLTQYKIWLAQYAAAPTYTATKYDMWQYSSKGSVSGISGNVDMNISYLGY